MSHPDLHALIEEEAHYLPDQGPIGVFIHHNTLHAFQHLPFHRAVREAQRTLGGEPYASEAFFRRALAARRIDEDVLLQIVEEFAVRRGLSVDDDRAVLPASRVRAIAMKHPLFPTHRHTLGWLVREGRFLTRFAADASSGAEKRLVEDGSAWLRRCLASGDAHLLPRLLSGRESDEDARSVLRDRGLEIEKEPWSVLLERNESELVLLALWQRALELAESITSTRSTPAVGEAVLTEERATARINGIMARHLSAYFDTGLAEWQMPGRDEGLYPTIRKLVAHDPALPEPWLREVQADFLDQEAHGDTAASAIERAMPLRIGAVEDARATLRRSLQALPGWAGLVARLERRPEDRPPSAPTVTLIDYLAVRMTYERHAPKESKQERGPLDTTALAVELFSLFQYAGLSPRIAHSLSTEEGARLVTAIDELDPLTRRELWQEAYERTYLRSIVDAVRLHGRAEAEVPKQASLQVMTCLDEREEAFRRHLEEIDPTTVTFGVAGFFGVAISYRGLDFEKRAPYCPAPVTPAHQVDEHFIDHEHGARWRGAIGRWGHTQRHLFHGSRSLVAGAVAAVGAGWFSALEWISDEFAPAFRHEWTTSVGSRVLRRPETALTTVRAADDSTLGFSWNEQADRVRSLLENAGLVRDFAPVVALLGHGSTSTNNPHRSAYDCGACGGRRGDVNARLFAQMANHPEVRQRLRAAGIDIPDGTTFIGGLHDTTTDEITWTDTHRPEIAKAIAQVRDRFAEACARSAQERCRRFESASLDLSPQAALRHVAQRATKRGEPRPECGHATNALCVVGRRSLTRGLFLDRRAFLVSYDPEIDTSGKILERTLAAVVPVGAGINLEYYFSFVDNEKYGCGTKLPHNVVGQIGVINGAEGDLRTGLPWQMVEIHEPMRLTCLVEATPERLLEIAGRQKEVAEFVLGGWIRLISVDPETSVFREFKDGAFQALPPPTGHLDGAPNSRAWYAGHRDHLPPARIAAGQPHAQRRRSSKKTLSLVRGGQT